MNNLHTTAGLLVLLLSFGAIAAEENIQINPPAAGSISQQQGLLAWSRIFEVASHPRCANCHTGPSDRPMWSGPSYGKTRVHGMNIQAGNSRIGAETILCSTCHTNKSEDWDNANVTKHAAPRVAMSWALAPATAHWFGRTTQQICEQLRNPESQPPIFQKWTPAEQLRRLVITKASGWYWNGLTRTVLLCVSTTTATICKPCRKNTPVRM